MPSIHTLLEAGSRERQYAPPAPRYACIMLGKDPIPLWKIPDLCVMWRSIGLVTELWSPRFVTEYWKAFFHICHAIAMSEIQLLATASWKCGFLQPFSCPCSQSVMHCRKEIFHTCLSKESMPFVKSKSPLPTRSLRLLRAAVHSGSPALWLHHSHPCVAAAEKNLSHAKKQRVWSRSCGVQDLLRNIPISDGSM